MTLLNKDDLPVVNTATKYPEILTYHALGERGRLTGDVTRFDGEVVLTEKVDGTNIRIVKDSYGDWVIGSREELLTAKGDRVANPFQGVVEALGDLPDRLPAPFGAIRVYFMEVYGGKIGGNAKQYTRTGQTSFRLFDVATVPIETLLWSVEEVSAWRKNGGQQWMSWDMLQALAGGIEGLKTVPTLGVSFGTELPAEHENTLDWLMRHLPRTRVGLDENGKSEGIVLRTKDRSLIRKARIQDYLRTLGIR